MTEKAIRLHRNVVLRRCNSLKRGSLSIADQFRGRAAMTPPHHGEEATIGARRSAMLAKYQRRLGTNWGKPECPTWPGRTGLTEVPLNEKGLEPRDLARLLLMAFLAHAHPPRKAQEGRL